MKDFVIKFLPVEIGDVDEQGQLVLYTMLVTYTCLTQFRAPSMHGIELDLYLIASNNRLSNALY